MRLELNIGSARASIINTFTLDTLADCRLVGAKPIMILGTECSLMVFSLPKKITQNYLFLVFAKACLKQSEARRL